MRTFACSMIAVCLLGIFVVDGAGRARAQSSSTEEPNDTAASPEQGQRLFNEYCSHCHGANAVQGERAQDLRRLKIRYGDERSNVYWTTVTVGRPDKGMPSWSEILDAKALQHIQAFLETAQR